jgi:L-ascorbate metabolism protein UlaG (beta-lactamase superfamily)
MTGIRLTHIGGPTVLIEAEGWRILTDPTFDPPGKTYSGCPPRGTRGAVTRRARSADLAHSANTRNAP